MKTWKIEINLKVSDNWIEDGFDASERIEEIAEMMQQLLPHAYGHEVQANVKIVKAPSKEVINKLQGYH
jgi:hypothetical protein